MVCSRHAREAASMSSFWPRCARSNTCENACKGCACASHGPSLEIFYMMAHKEYMNAFCANMGHSIRSETASPALQAFSTLRHSSSAYINMFHIFCPACTFHLLHIFGSIYIFYMLLSLRLIIVCSTYFMFFALFTYFTCYHH